MFDLSIFLQIFVPGVVIALVGWLMLREIEHVSELNNQKLDELLSEIYRAKRHNEQVKRELIMLKGRINALKVDIDVLHDALMKQLREPPRR